MQHSYGTVPCKNNLTPEAFLHFVLIQPPISMYTWILFDKQHKVEDNSQEEKQDVWFSFFFSHK